VSKSIPSGIESFPTPIESFCPRILERAGPNSILVLLKTVCQERENYLWAGVAIGKERIFIGVLSSFVLPSVV
jgi:hypothetical protein